MSQSLFQKNRIKTTYVLVIAASLTIACLGFFLYQNHIKKQIAEYTEILKGFEERFDQYLYDDFADSYTILIDKYQSGLNSKDFSLLEECCQELDSLESSIIEHNTKTLNGQISQLKQMDLSNAYENELEQLAKLQTKIEDKMEQHNFKKAASLIDKWSDLIENMSFVADNLSIYVKQADTSKYPLVNLYLSIHDIKTDEVPKDLIKENCFIVEQQGIMPSIDNPEREPILYMEQLDQNLPVFITLVADMGHAKSEEDKTEIASNIRAFLEKVQFDVKDQVQIIAITDTISVIQEFTSDKEQLIASLSNLTTTNSSTPFYDGLIEAVTSTASHSGAKCVIAFTNGEDNLSSHQWKDVVSLSKEHSVPVFMIGIGSDISPYVLERIGVQTNGAYRNIKKYTSLDKAFLRAYKEMKQLYQVDYKSKIKFSHEERHVLLSYEHRLYGGTCEYPYKASKKAD